MNYEVEVIVEGALDENHTFEDWDRADAYIESVRQVAARDGRLTEVYVTEHPHEIEQDECICAQYKSSHLPDYIFRQEG